MRATDLIVLGGVLLGATVAVAGLSQVDHRVREHLGRGEQTVGRTALLAAGLVLVGLAIVFIAIG